MTTEIERMLDAYKLLFVIETTLKEYIDVTLSKNYGQNWKIRLKEKRNIQNLYYHEVISFYGKYPPLNQTFTPIEKELLYSLTPIRNKIAHMKLINNDEYTNLEKCHTLLKRKFE